MDEYLAYFEWDDVKAELNFEKHGVLFEDAVLTFFDKDFIRLWDEKHSESEIRYVGIGSHPMKLLFVTIYTERGNKFRIISSRKANRKERHMYEELQA